MGMGGLGPGEGTEASGEGGVGPQREQGGQRNQEAWTLSPGEEVLLPGD